MPCLHVYGDTGMGKTKIIRKFARDHGPVRDQVKGVTHMPVVAIQMTPEPFEHVHCELLTALVRPGLNQRDPRSNRETCRALMRAMNTRMLIVDQNPRDVGWRLPPTTDLS